MRLHRPSARTVVTTVIVGLFALGAAGCTTATKNQAVPGPTVTVTAAAAPAPTVTVTVTASPSASAGQVLLDKSGYGDWNSPPFTVSSSGSPELQVTYSYSGNSDSNFIADVENSSDDQSIANTIGTSGGATTDVYPDTTSGSLSYHLSVEATGNWTVKITEVS